MPATFVLLLKINAALLLFCAGYYLVLRKLTFYTLNRAYLVTAILFASIYPWIDFSAFVQRHEELARPIEQIAINWQAPSRLIQQPEQAIDYWYWLSVVFWIGAGVLFIKLAMQLFSLLRLYKTSKPRYINGYQVRIMDKDAAPFSFWQSIYINPQKHEAAELEAILQHEQIHVNQWHTADILLAELSSIFYWFNPGIWLIKKAVRENIEFITDQKILKNGIDSKTYQYSLVNVSFNNAQPGIVNHFNISTIKKRIIMMNAKRSSKLNLTRYAFVVPAVMALLLVFSISKADFAKPMRITLAAAVQPLAGIIINHNEVADPVAKVAKAPKAAKKAKGVKPLAPLAPMVAPQAALSPLTAIAITPKPAKNDTNKRLKLIVRDFKKDSLVFVVNGKISTGKNLDPTNIENMYMLTGSQARKFAKVDDDKAVKVAYVITKDATNKEELEKAVARDLVIRKVVATNLNGDVTVSDDNDIALVVADKNNRSNGKTYTNVKTVVVNGTSSSSSSTGSSGGAVTLNGTKGKPLTKAFTIVSDGTSVSSGDDVIVTGYGIKKDSKVIKVNGLSITTDNGNEPLFVIDGKASTVDALKKLDTDKIESISILKGEDATKKYGDKAKNGVVVIDTRKK